MDMPGRGLHDERDSGIARSGGLMRLGGNAWIDLHSAQLPDLFRNVFLTRAVKERSTHTIPGYVSECLGSVEKP